MRPSQRALVFVLSLALTTTPIAAGPTVVPTAEGQLGDTPGVGEQILGPARIESIRGQAGDLLLGGLFIPGGSPPPPSEFEFLTDMIHGYPEPVPVDTVASPFVNIEKVTPASAWSRNAANDGDFVAFSFAVDGAMPETLTVRIATYDENGTTRVQVPIAEDISTFTMFLDPRFAKTGVAVDNQGRVTVAYTEFFGGLPRVKAARADATTGTIIDPDFLVNDAIRGNPDVALLDPAGNRLIVVTEELTSGPGVRGNIIDFSGGSPVVLPEFVINTTVSDFGDLNPAVAADPATGNFTVVWDAVTGLQGDPIDVRGRRFDAMGNPIGNDFQINTTDGDTQAQPTVAYGNFDNLSAVAWAADSTMPMGTDDLDVFLQIYDADGNPIDGEIKVNTFSTNTQDRPAVRFLPERDALGRPQVVVTWRDTGNAAGTSPRGTGVSYRCFSINGFEEAQPIFADGFESGDTTSWSDEQP